MKEVGELTVRSSRSSETIGTWLNLAFSLAVAEDIFPVSNLYLRSGLSVSSPLQLQEYLSRHYSYAINRRSGCIYSASTAGRWIYAAWLRRGGGGSASACVMAAHVAAISWRHTGSDRHSALSCSLGSATPGTAETTTPCYRTRLVGCFALLCSHPISNCHRGDIAYHRSFEPQAAAWCWC
jgi:hypothetical protein